MMMMMTTTTTMIMSLFMDAMYICMWPCVSVCLYVDHGDDDDDDDDDYDDDDDDDNDVSIYGRFVPMHVAMCVGMPARYMNKNIFQMPPFSIFDKAYLARNFDDGHRATA